MLRRLKKSSLLVMNMIIGVIVLGIPSVHAQNCETKIIKTRDMVRADTIDLRVVNNDQIVIAEESPMQVSNISFPLKLESCEGVTKYYLWRVSSTKVYLVEKASFACYEVAVTGLDETRPAGAPGSGFTNKSCL